MPKLSLKSCGGAAVVVDLDRGAGLIGIGVEQVPHSQRELDHVEAVPDLGVHQALAAVVLPAEIAEAGLGRGEPAVVRTPRPSALKLLALKLAWSVPRQSGRSSSMPMAVTESSRPGSVDPASISTCGNGSTFRISFRVTLNDALRSSVPLDPAGTRRLPAMSTPWARVSRPLVKYWTPWMVLNPAALRIPSVAASSKVAPSRIWLSIWMWK